MDLGTSPAKPVRRGMLCPVDGTALESAHPLGALHSCPKCEGQLAHTENLVRIVQNHGFDLLKLKAQGGRERSCPGCWTTMRIYDLDGLEIDLCPVCILVWMDAGEWPRLKAYVQKAGRERAAIRPAEDPEPWDWSGDILDDWERPTVFGLLFNLIWDRLFRKW